jgi:sec-independent protein translocase protein TatA
MLPSLGSPAAWPTLAVFGLPGQMEAIIVLVIVLLLFGNKLPGAMRNLGQSFVQFKKGIKDSGEEGGDPDGQP